MPFSDLGIYLGDVSLLEIEHYTKDPVKAQNALLRKILRRSRTSEYGRKYRFDRIASVEAFRRTVPLSTYADYAPYVERMMRGERNLMYTGRNVRYCTSSGSVGKPKMLPKSVSDLWKMQCIGFSCSVATAAHDLRRKKGVRMPRQVGLLTMALTGHTAPDGKKIENPDTRVCVYLPKGSAWYDYIGVHRYPGGTTVDINNANMQTLPLYVRAGAILPLGADVQHTGELSGKPLTIRVYPGCDGRFVFYDDAGDGYGYEKGECARIEMLWDEKKRVFTAKAQQGAYPGMPEARVLNIFVAGDAMKTVTYTGEEVSVQF